MVDLSHIWFAILLRVIGGRKVKMRIHTSTSRNGFICATRDGNDTKITVNSE